MSKNLLRIIFTVTALAAAITGYATGQTWLYMVCVVIAIIGVAVVTSLKVK